MKYPLTFALICLSASAYAQQGQGIFNITPAPCDSAALISGGWCLDVVQAVPPLGPTVPPPPIITGPFATVTTAKVNFYGTGVPGDTISLSIDDILDPSGSVTVQSSGSWQYHSGVVLTKGPHFAKAVQKNAIGISAASAPLTFAVAIP